MNFKFHQCKIEKNGERVKDRSKERKQMIEKKKKMKGERI